MFLNKIKHENSGLFKNEVYFLYWILIFDKLYLKGASLGLEITMSVFAVVRTVGGYAREDAAEPALVGVYSDPDLAADICRLAGGNSRVVPFELDYINPDLRDTAHVFGITLRD